MNIEQKVSDNSFETGLFKRVPDDIRDSFTQEQIDALRVAFGARKWGKHPVDIRGTLSIWTWRYYFVILMGRNRRELSRAEQRTARIMQAMFITLFLTFSTLLGILVLYLLKSAAGIDLIPGYSFGVWGWFKSNVF